MTRWVVLAALLVAGGSAAGEDPKSGDGLTFPGRVIELETGKPVEGAAVIVDRSVRGADPRTLPPWAGESTIGTDADGRFQLSFPSEQVSERRLTVMLRIKHPEFISRKSQRVLLAELIRGRARGEEPFFATIKLDKGVTYSAQVVTPAGKPVPGIPYWFENWARGNNQSRHFWDDEGGDTDDDGRIRLRMAKTQSLAINVGPPRSTRARFPYAPYRHFWGTDRASQHPDVWAPTDLDRIVLARGIRLSGRLVDTEGRPIAGRAIEASPSRGRGRHSTTTEDDGSFALGPLRPGNYVIHGGGQYASGVDPDATPLLRPIRVIRPIQVYLKQGETPAPLVLREMPSVRVEVRFVDPAGKPTIGGPTTLFGTIPKDRDAANLPGAGGRGLTPASEINAPEPPNPARDLDWGEQDVPGLDGRVVFDVPAGLQQAMLQTHPFDETIAYKTRLTPDGALRRWGGGRLGPIEDGRQITIVCYRAPTVLVTLKSEDGPVPDDLMVDAYFTVNGGSYGESFVRQQDGRYRSHSLMPEQDYEISASQRNGLYFSSRLERINLPEGGSAELTLLLRKRPEPLAVGKPAPPFSVQTLDGRTIRLDSLRGKTVLLHFWDPHRGVRDATSLKAIHDRFGKDDRFAMIGVCLADNADAATPVIQSAGLSWPQALLRDRGRDPIVIDYGTRPPYKSFLIGPDGTLIARDLEGDSLEKAVAEALSRK